MAHILDRQIDAARTVADVLLDPLTAEGTLPTVVDVGARNGIMLPSAYARRSGLIGFEPNVAEYNKLLTRSTDAERAGISTARFKKEEYHNCALWNEETSRSFYITAGTGACTLLGETDSNITTKMFLEGKSSYEELHTKVLKTVPVECRTLDCVVGDGRKIDILKLDVEGAELQVLQGAIETLRARNILFVKTEFVLFEYYRGDHRIFGHQHVFLNELGFRLLDIDLNHPKYTRGPTSLSVIADRRLVYAGDAYFALDPDRVALSGMDLHRSGIAALVFGFHSFGMSLLRDGGVLSSGEISTLERELNKVTLKRRLRHAWTEFPYKMARVLALFH